MNMKLEEPIIATCCLCKETSKKCEHFVIKLVKNKNVGLINTLLERKPVCNDCIVLEGI